MASNYTPVQDTYTLKPVSLQKTFHFPALSAYAYTAYHIAGVTLLTMIVLRIFFALLFVEGPAAAIVTAVTNPFISPFNNLIPSLSTMVQAGAALAYCVYLGLYFAVNSTIKTALR